MKLVTATFATAILFALAGVAPNAHAQDQQQQQEKAHPAKPQQQQQKPAHPQTTRPPQQQKQTQHPAEQQAHHQQAQQKQQQKTQRTVEKSQQKAQQQQQKTQQKAQRTQQKQQQKTQQRAASHAQPSRTQRAEQGAAPARGGQPAQGHPQQTAHYEQAHFRRYTPQHGERVLQRIPDAQFKEHFGRAHRFSIGTPMMVGGFPRFQYSGFWFVLEEPWPGYWAYGNYYYILFTDGNYWLCDYDDPGVQIELVVIV
jgi:hypothetical protein